MPLDTIAPGCPPHLNSAILDLKGLKLSHLQIFFLGSENDSSFRARWRPRRWLGDRNGSHVSRRKVVGCQSSTSTWALSGGFAARSSTHCYTSIMGPFIAAVSCSILWSNLISFLSLLLLLYTISVLAEVVWFGGCGRDCFSLQWETALKQNIHCAQKIAFHCTHYIAFSFPFPA